jgi:hypothetical protein
MKNDGAGISDISEDDDEENSDGEVDGIENDDMVNNSNRSPSC